MVALRLPPPFSTSQEDGRSHVTKPATPVPLELSSETYGDRTEPHDDNSIPAVQNGCERVESTHRTLPEAGDEQSGFEERDHRNLKTFLKEGGGLHGLVEGDEQHGKLPNPSNQCGVQNGSPNVENMDASIQAAEQQGNFFKEEAVLACNRLEDANHTRGCMGKGRVKWSDSYGKELVHVLEFETSDTYDSEEEDNVTYSHICSCTIQ